MTASLSEPILLQVLGPVYVRRPDGSALPRSLTQPRPLAVLAYLALARPRGMHSRDTLLAMLWPESSQASGRHALRNALHVIRQALGEDVLITAGDGLVGVDPSRVTCDAVELERELAVGGVESALQSYHGELLQGFFVAGAPEFERWLDDERRRLRDSVRTAGWGLASRNMEGGDLAGAAEAARRAHALAPEDERGLSRLMETLTAAGDRAGAWQAYEEFAARLQEEYGMDPSAETVARAEAIRGPISSGTATGPPDDARVARRDRRAPPRATRLETPTFDEPADLVPKSEKAEDHSSAPPTAGRPFFSRRRVLAVAGILVVLTGAGLVARFRTSSPSPESSDPMAIQARQQATALGATIPAHYRADTANFQRYFRAEEILDRGSVPAARDSMRRLTEDAPLYAPAWTGYASALSLSGFVDIPPLDALPRSLAAVERGLALDSTLLEGAVVLIAYDMFYKWDLDAARRKLDAALARAPDDPSVNNVLGAWYRWRGDMAKAVEVKRRAAALEPLSPWLTEQVAWDLYLSHRCAEAAESYQRLINEGRMTTDQDFALFHTFLCLGRRDDAAAALQASLIRSGDSALARLLDPPLDSARRDEAFHTVARARLTRYLEARRRRWLPAESAVFDYADLGNADSTLVWLDSMWVEHSMMLHIVPFDPALDFLRPDPRFRAFIARLPWKPKVPPQGE